MCVRNLPSEKPDVSHMLVSLGKKNFVGSRWGGSVTQGAVAQNSQVQRQFAQQAGCGGWLQVSGHGCAPLCRKGMDFSRKSCSHSLGRLGKWVRASASACFSPLVSGHCASRGLRHGRVQDLHSLPREQPRALPTGALAFREQTHAVDENLLWNTDICQAAGVLRARTTLSGPLPFPFSEISVLSFLDPCS